MSMDADKSGVKRRKLAAASKPMFVGMSDGVCPTPAKFPIPEGFKFRVGMGIMKA